MRQYIIDGNNLIGKIEKFKKLQKPDKSQSRGKLAMLLSRYFSHKKVSVNLFFDGYENDKINVDGIKINYSGSLTADERIKTEIEKSKNPRNILVITSDNNLAEFAKVCRCTVIKSEEFAKQIYSVHTPDEEQSRIAELNNSEEFKKLFGVE